MAQKVKFYGVVQDKNGKKLAAASVVAAQLKTNAYQGFSITDDDGVFDLDLGKNNAYIIKVSYMGYQPVLDTIYTKENDVFKKYTLQLDQEQLDGVEIKYEMPVSVKGDTIVYNTDAFTTGNEKQLSEVLQKMPGIEVAKDGTVKVEGQTVKKVLIEGQDFFEGDSKLASKNIPANAVKKVEVLRNFNENAQLGSFENNEDSYAINIRLKKGKKNFWFGEITAGGGTDDHYLSHNKLFYYTPKKTYNIITDFNNIGSVPMSFMDYFKMTGGIGGHSSRSRTAIQSATNTLGFSLLPNDKALAVTTQFGAFNFTVTPSPELTWKGFFIVNSQDTDMLTENEKIYTTNDINEITKSVSNQSQFSAIAKTGLEYNPNESLSLKYDLLLKKTDLEQEENITSNIRADNQNLDDSESYSIDQQVELYKTLENENLITWTIQHNYSENQPMTEAISTEEFFSTSSLINLAPQSLYDIIQQQNIDNLKLSSIFDYYIILNKASHIDLSLGADWNKQNFDSNILQKIDDGQEILLNDIRLQNQAEYKFSDIYSGLYYKTLWGSLEFRPGVSLHYYYLEDTQFGDTKTDEKWYLLPELKLRYNFKNRGRLNFSYMLTNSFSDVKKYAQGYILNSYNSLSSGNRDLENVLKHQFSLRYFIYSTSKFYHLFTRLTYNRSVQPIRNKTELLETDIISYPVNLDNTDESLNYYLSFSKRYVYWKYHLNANINSSKYYSIINDDEISSTSLSQNYKAEINSNFSGFLNFDLSYNINFNQFDSDLRNTLYITESPSVGVELRMFQKTTLLSIKYDYYNYRDDERTVENQYSFLSADLYYQKPGSHWEFVLSASNLLNNESIDKESLTDLYIATSKYYIMPQYVMLKMTYKL